MSAGMAADIYNGLVDHATSEVVALVAGSCLYLGKRVGKWLKSRQEQHTVAYVVNRDVGVYQLMTELQMKAKADRVRVYQFHNGTYYVNDSSQIKMSCTHEIVDDGISREMPSLQNMLVSQYSDTVSRLIANGKALYNVSANSREEGKQLLKSHGVQTAICHTFSDAKGCIEGFVSLNYHHALDCKEADTVCEPEDTELLELLEEYTLRIGHRLRH